jgi:uncharacterized Rmd1/YagE family protein
MASSSTTETTPLMQSHTSSSTEPERKASRNVTFNPNPAISYLPSNSSSRTPQQSVPSTVPPAPTSASQQLMLSAFNSKLRRRNSHGAPIVPLPSGPISKIGPQRTTKNAQKLKLLPNPDFGEDGPDEESGRDVYSQYTRIKDPTARRDAARLGKADRDRLPRVTAYCTASKYQMDNLMRFLKGIKGKNKGASPKLFDECIYTPYNYHPSRERKRSLEIHSTPALRERRHSDSALQVENSNAHGREDLLDLHTDGGDTSLSNGEHMGINRMHSGVVEQRVRNKNVDESVDFDTQVHTPEIFLFDYGVVVIWGMSLKEETRFLKEIVKFEIDKLAPDDVETECFNFYYTREYQARIYNDFITLREKGNYMTKLAISHALAQSVKVSKQSSKMSSCH